MMFHYCYSNQQFLINLWLHLAVLLSLTDNINISLET